MSTPATGIERLRSSVSVSSVWLIVPSPDRAAMIAGNSRAAIRSAITLQSFSGTSTPPAPSMTQNRSLLRVCPRRISDPISISWSARRADRCGDNGLGSRTPRSTISSSEHAARRRTSAVSSSCSMPVWIGFQYPTRPNRRRAATSRLDTTVFPTSVSVPVTKTPATSQTPPESAASTSRG